MGYITGFDRDQTVLFPSSLEESIDENIPVRLVDLFIRGLDLAKLGFKKNVKVEDGRPGYDPADLLKLYLYGYLNRIRTSRLLERECKRNIELIWLLRGLQPCFRRVVRRWDDVPGVQFYPDLRLPKLIRDRLPRPKKAPGKMFFSRFQPCGELLSVL